MLHIQLNLKAQTPLESIKTNTIPIKSRGDLLVYGPGHVVDHRETANGLQEVIIWPTGNSINDNTDNICKYENIGESVFLPTQKKLCHFATCKKPYVHFNIM